MNEALRESISALMDDEATELELHRILRESEQSEARELWASMHTVQTAMQRRTPILCPRSVSTDIRNALAREPAHSRGRFSPALPRIAASVAVVALVTVATFAGLSGPSQPSTSVVDRLDAVDAQLADARVYQPGQLRGISYRAAYASGSQPLDRNVQTGELSPAAVAARTRLNRYLQRHLEYASLNSNKGMMPFARVAAVQDGQP